MQELLLTNPKRRRARKRRTLNINPRRRQHRHRRRRSTALFAKNPRPRRRVLRFRRNPMPSINSLSRDLKPAVIGAAGALACDWVIGNVPLPATLTTGIMLPITRIGLAIGVGWAASSIAGPDTGQKVLLGALVVTSYSIIKNFLAQNVPGMQLARFVPARQLNGLRGRGLGFANPGRVLLPGNAGPRIVQNNPAGSHLNRYVRR